MEDNRSVQGRPQRGLQVPPTGKQRGQERSGLNRGSAGLRMPGSNETVERKVQQRRTEEEQRSRMEIQRRKSRLEGEYEENIEDDRRMEKRKQSNSQKAKKSKQKIKRLWAILGGELVVFFLILLGYAVFYANSKMNQMNYNEIDGDELGINEGLEITSEKYTTIALFGIDARDVTTDVGNRSDTIMIARIDNETKEVKLVSVFRDSYMELSNRDGRGDGLFTKITHAYAYGGPKAAVATLNKNLDLQITEYVTVNFASLTEVIDDLGGITVNVDYDEMLEINRIIPETAEITGKNFMPLNTTGDVTLDGLQATTYCRIRYNVAGGGDIGRAERQREVISAILNKAKQSDLSTLNSILDDVSTNVSTSLSKKELLTLMSGIFDYELTESQGFPFIYHMGNYYDQTLDQELSMDVPGNLEDNVILLHEFLYDAVSENSVSADGSTEGDATGGAMGQPTSGGKDSQQIYKPSSEVIRISKEIEENTGVLPPEDSQFRGAY